jgi:hypothetical protein
LEGVVDMSKVILVFASFVVFMSLGGVCLASEKTPAGTLGLKIESVEKKVLASVKDARTIGKNSKILSMKIRIDYAGNGPVTMPVTRILLKTASGKACDLVGIGGGANDFDSFNVYFPFKAPWTPFSMTYKENDTEKDLFGMKQKSGSAIPEITFFGKNKTILMGFVIPAGNSDYQLRLGDSNTIKVSAK